MRYFTFYNPNTGAVVASGSCPDDQYDVQHMENFRKIEGRARPNLDFVENGVVKLKTPMAVHVAGTTLANLPNPSVVQVDREFYTVTDGRLEIEFPYPGTYRVRVASPKYLPFETELTV